MTRIQVTKTYKLFINGAFPRTESGRSWPITTPSGETYAHLCLASRKDLRDAVEAARAAQPKWQAATAYNRGQILYRMAEMMEGKRDELAEAIAFNEPPARAGAKNKKSPAIRRTSSLRLSISSSLSPSAEVCAAIDRLVYYAGWCDKFAQVVGCNNPVAGPYYNFTVPEPTGVVAILAPDEAPLLGLISLLAPALVPGNATIVVASNKNPVPAAVLGEVFATSDLPAGIVNILTAKRDELMPHLAPHRDIDAITAASLNTTESQQLREGVAENLKRVCIADDTLKSREVAWQDERAQGLEWIKPTLEFKTIWHPALA
ncbi:MAG: aldehyde dehydrogenase family protein [Phycisphaerales bacterium]